MVRLRANEVVDDRVLLARAQAEIKRLKRRLREALEGTLLGAAAEHNDDDGDNADETNTGSCHHHEGGTGPDNARVVSSMIKVGSAYSCAGGPGEGGKEDERGGLEDSITTTAGTTTGEQDHCASTSVGKEETGGIPAAAGTITTATTDVQAVQKRQAAKLIAENERLREDNDRLRADIQRLILRSNKQRLKRQRRQQRGVGRPGNNTPHGPLPSPIDWSARYAVAAAEARRRRPASSHRPSSDLSLSRRVSSSASSVSSSRMIMTGRKRNTDPGRAVAVTAAATEPARVTNLPKFRRRQFDDLDEGERQGQVEDEGDSKHVEDGLSAEEIRAIIGNNAGAEETEAMPTSAGNQEEDEEAIELTQLAMFRRELQEGVVSKPFAKRGGGSGGGGGKEGRRRGGGDALENNGGVLVDNSAGNGNQHEETDIEVFLDHAQRLEDMMFEAQGRERQRLREERARLACAREQRLALEAQLAGLSGGRDDGIISVDTDNDTQTPATTTTEGLSETTYGKSVLRLPVRTTTPSARAEEIKGQPAHSPVWKNYQQQQQQEHHHQHQQPPSFDGAISATTASSVLGVEGSKRVSSSNSSHNNTNTNTHNTTHNSGVDGDKRIGWAEQPNSTASTGRTTPAATTATATNATTTAMMMAVLAPTEESSNSNNSEVCGTHSQDNNYGNTGGALAGGKARRTVPATKLPPERRQKQQTEQETPAPILLSHQSSSSSSGSRQRRPATSTGGPPTDSSKARSRSRRIGRGGGSRSPVRGGRLAFLDSSSPHDERNSGGSGNSKRYRPRQQQRQQQGKLGGGDGGGGVSTATPTNTAAVAVPKAPPSPERTRKFGSREIGRSPLKGSDHNEQGGATKGSLAYGVADLGLRLKVRKTTAPLGLQQENSKLYQEVM